MLETQVKFEPAAIAATRADIATVSRLGLITLLLLCAATWAIGHSYGGLVHDARLYTLQALAHLVPRSLSQDVFMRFGSQDRYTIFSPIYAAAIQLVGAEPAAAALTLISQLLFVLGAWLLARTFLPTHRALLAVAILIAIPGEYGPDNILRVMENFVTPRLLSEALGLAALAAALARRRWLSVACIVGAALLHPIMAAAAAVAALCLYVAIPHPRLAVMLGISAVLSLVVGTLLFPIGILSRFDTAWLELVKERDPYLFLAYWRMDDWVRAAIPLATLAGGWRMSPDSRGRTLCQVTFITGVAGLALSWLAGDQLHVVLLTQLQPWRWEWLAVAVGALTLPLVIWHCWQTDLCGRAFALWLISAWIFGSGKPALVSVAAATASIMLVHRLKLREARCVFIGACAALILALVWQIASNLVFADAVYYDPHTLSFQGRLISFTHDGTTPVAVALLASWLSQRPRGAPLLALLAAVLFAACAALFPATWSGWSHRQYAPRLQALFAPWRQRIPLGANVFWPDSPVEAWLLLERPDYLSVVQTSEVLFSREAAMEMARRAAALSAIVPETAFLSWESEKKPSLGLNPQQMALICETSEVPFVVTNMDLHVHPLATLPKDSWLRSNGLKLYRCSDLSG